jgi:hypothetical protein
MIDWKEDVHKNGAVVFIYYCNKLREGGFLEGGPLITVEGFDMAVDLVDSGFTISEEFALACCEELQMDIRIADLVIAVQELGLKEMLKISKEQENDNN